MNEVKIFDSIWTANLPRSEQNPWLGRVYAVEFGGQLKIGSSKKLYQRVMALKRTAAYAGEQLGRICFTNSCTNYRECEKLMHSIFSKHCVKGTELFGIPITSFAAAAEQLELLDESKRLCEESMGRAEFLKTVLLSTRKETQ